jgi:transposase
MAAVVEDQPVLDVEGVQEGRPGCSYATIASMTGCSSRTIALWKHRFVKDGHPGLSARHRGSKPTVLTALEARIMNVDASRAASAR